jgi:hypothetical protein
MNGSGVLFLMLAICYRRLNDYKNSLKWKTLASKSGAFYDGNEFGPAEIWRIIDLSTIDELRILNQHAEIEYIKSHINESDLSYIYVPRDYMGSSPIGDMLKTLQSMRHYHATIDYEHYHYKVYTKDDELVRTFSTDGLMAIIHDMMTTIRKMPSALDNHFKMYFEEMDIKQMN